MQQTLNTIGNFPLSLTIFQENFFSVLLTFFVVEALSKWFWFGFFGILLVMIRRLPTRPGCVTTISRHVIYFFWKKEADRKGGQGANESLSRPLEIRKVWQRQWNSSTVFSQLPSSALLVDCCCCCSRSRTRPQHLMRRPLVVCSSCMSLCLLNESESKWGNSQMKRNHQGRERRPSSISLEPQKAPLPVIKQKEIPSRKKKGVTLLLANRRLQQTLAGKVQLVFGVQEPLVEPLETAAHLIELHLCEQKFRLRLVKLGR